MIDCSILSDVPYFLCSISSKQGPADALCEFLLSNLRSHPKRRTARPTQGAAAWRHASVITLAAYYANIAPCTQKLIVAASAYLDMSEIHGAWVSFRGACLAISLVIKCGDLQQVVQLTEPVAHVIQMGQSGSPKLVLSEVIFN